MPDIFISYSRTDAAAAGLFANHFSTQGWSVWWDRAIPVGEIFPREIQSNLEASRCVVVLWSPRAVESDWVLAEASNGLTRKILVPVLIEAAQPPLPFTVLQTIDLCDWRSPATTTGVTSLLRAIQTKLRSPEMIRLKPLAPVPDRVDPEYQQALTLFAEGHFVSALPSFRSVVARDPRNFEARYYLVLCALAGLRPKLLATQKVVRIDEHLREAVARAKGDSAHIRYLWAILRYDCYTFNGLREPSPTAKELLAGGLQLDARRAREITSAISAPGNPVWESILSQSNSAPEEGPHLRT